MAKNIIILDTDQAFKDSPDTGHSTCICSRCQAKIQMGEMPLRAWTQNEEGEVDKNSLEYRYCESCWIGEPFDNETRNPF